MPAVLLRSALVPPLKFTVWAPRKPGPMRTPQSPAAGAMPDEDWPSASGGIAIATTEAETMINRLNCSANRGGRKENGAAAICSADVMKPDGECRDACIAAPPCVYAGPPAPTTYPLSG